MAKKIDTSNLSVDYKQLMRMTVQDRVGLAKSGLGEELMQSLTPTQLALAFPKYYARQLPDIGRVITTGGAAPTYGGTAPSYGGGRPSQTAAPVPSTPSGRQNPQSSSAAKENQQNEFLNEIRRQVQERQQQGTQQTNINQYQRIPGGIDRTSKLNELKDPETKKLFATLLHAEVGGYGPKDHQAFAEKVFNRAMIENKSLKQILSDKRYFEPYQNGAFRKAQQAIDNNPNLLNSHLSTIDRVGYTGVDSIRGATHNASGSVAAAVRGEKPHQKYGDFNSVKSSIVVVGRETFYSKTWEQEKIRNLPRIAASSQTSKEDATGIIPQDQSRSQSGVTTGTRSGVSGAESESQLIERGAGVRGFTYAGREKGGGECVKGSQGVLGALLGDTKKFSQQIGHRAAGSMTLDGGNNYLSGTGYFNSPSQMTSDYLKDPKQWRIGDTVVAQGGGRGLGHIQVWNGKAWVSDFKQTGILVNNYSGHTLYRLNNDALSRLHPNYLKQMDGNGATSSYMSVNRINPGVSSTLGTDKEATPFSTQTEEIKKPSNYDSWPKVFQNYLKRNPDIEKEIFNAHALGVPVLDAFNKAYEKNPKLFEQSSEATADLVKTITNTPPGELPSTILGTDLQGSNVSAKPYERVVTNISGYSPGSPRPKAAGPGKVESTTEELNILKRGIDDRGPSLGYHAAVASFYHNKETGEKIDETSYNKLPNSQKQNYIEKAEVHQLRNPNKRVASMGGINPTTGKSWNADTYAVVRVGKMSPEKIRAYEDHLAEKLARGEIPELAIRNIYGDGQLRPAERGHLEKSTGGEGVSDAKNINKQRIFERAEKIREQIQQQQAQPQVTVTPPNTQTQQDQAPVPAEAVATPSPSKLEAEKPSGQENQGGGVSPSLRGGVSSAAATAVPVPTQEDVPSNNAYGGRETTTENVGFFDTETGKTLGTMKRGEVATVNRSGIVDLTPQQRIGEVAQLRPEFNQQIQQEQPQQQSNQPVASMTPSTQMPQSQPNMYNDANQIYGGMMGSIYNMPGSMRKAIGQTRFFNPDIEMGFNTLKA